MRGECKSFELAWRPTHGSASQQMAVNMKHVLSAKLSVVDYQSESVTHMFLMSNGFGGNQDLSHEFNVFGLNIGDPGNVSSWHDKYMGRCLPLNVVKGEHGICLVDFACGQLPRDYLAEDTVSSHRLTFRTCSRSS